MHRAAGKELLAECRTLKGCSTGDAKITKGYKLKATYVIHTVGPVWYGGNRREEELLKGCYSNSLKLAVQNGISTIAFPAISTGVYRYPKNEAVKVAVDSVKRFLESAEGTYIKKVVFVCFDDFNYQLYLDEIGKI